MTLLVSLTSFVLLAGVGKSAAEPSPTDTVKSAIVAVMHILNDPAFEQPGRSNARRSAIEQVVRGFVSDQDMARRSLGVAWAGLDDSERRQFRDLFIQLLRDAVACRIHEYAEAQVIYLSEHASGMFADVPIIFRGAKVDTMIDVRMVNRSGHWLMYDAVIDGVSLVDNYRAQFGQLMRSASYVGLVGTLEANVRIVKSFERTQGP